MNQDKRTWRAPELIDIGNVVDLTEGMGTNVRDNQGQDRRRTTSRTGTSSTRSSSTRAIPAAWASARP